VHYSSPQVYRLHPTFPMLWAQFNSGAGNYNFKNP